MAWTRVDSGTYECIDYLTQPVVTPVKVVKSNEYYVYIFTVSERKTVTITLSQNPSGGLQRPAGRYAIGMGDVPEPSEGTGAPPDGNVWKNVNLYYTDNVEFDAMPGVLYWIWMTPISAGPGNTYAVEFNILISSKFAEPIFDVANVGPDGLSVKVMDKYSKINGSCQIYIDGVYQDDLIMKSSTNWQEWGKSGLRTGTYTITVTYINVDDGTLRDMQYYFGTPSSPNSATINIQGAGSAGSAYFTATGDSTTNTIMVDIVNYNSISPQADHFIYNISEESDGSPVNVESTSVGYDFTNLMDGEWRITVYAVLNNGRVIRIPTRANGSTYAITITLSGSGGGGEEPETWDIVSENLGTMDSPYVNFRYYEKYTLYRFRASFEYSGNVTFYFGASTTGAVANPTGWITEYTTTYNSDDGEPPPSALVPGKYAADDSSMTLYVAAGTEYCFWFRLKNGGDTGYTYVGIEPPNGSSTAWKYNSSYLDIKNISTTQTKDVRLQSYEGALFKVTFASAGIARFSVSIPGQTAHIYVTTGQYSWTIDGIPLTESGGPATEMSGSTYPVLADTDYYVWVKGSDINVRGTATVTITFAQSWNYIYNSNLNIRSISSAQTRQTSVSRYTGTCFLVTFATAGTATVSVSGENAYIVFSTDGYHEWDPEDGLPYKDDRKNKATGGTHVSIDVSTTDSYYVWVRGSSENTAGNNIIVTIGIQTIDSKGFWVCINKGTQQNPNYEFIKVTVYVYVNKGTRQNPNYEWAKTRPYIYTASRWVGGM